MRGYIVRTALVVSVLLASGAAEAQFSFGGAARFYGMGGAGLAVIDANGRGSSINPASLATMSRRFVVEFPTIAPRVRGIDYARAYDYLFNPPRGNAATTLATLFGKNDSEVGVNLNWGMRLGHIDARLTGAATARLLPNAQLQAWAQSGAPVSALAPVAVGGNPNFQGAKADLIGAAIYTLPTVGIAERVTPAGSPLRVEVGARAKIQRALYSHFIADGNAIVNGSTALRAPELAAANKDYLDATGLGVDFGVLAHSKTNRGFSGAMVITNLIGSQFRFSGTDRNGAATTYQLQARSASVGTAYTAPGFTAAFDVLDLTRSFGATQMRVGAEYRLGSFAFRGGYANMSGFTVGVGLFGFLDLAYGRNTPIEITQVLRF